jgi:L-aspartate oxidase
MSDDVVTTDFLVIGSGIAGLWFAYRAARHGRVLVVTKKSDTESNTNYAQGGIAAAFGSDDSPDLHVADTVRAGDGLCREEVVRAVAREGPVLVKELNGLGVGFDTYADSLGERHFQLGREGGHLRARIVHARDFTGQAVEHGLVRAAKTHPNVRLLENVFALDLVKDAQGGCVGCTAFGEQDHTRLAIRARATLLATGGIGQVYCVTTNPPIATGDGIAMAFRARARIANMEFIQFHPTALYGQVIDGRAFLISEAMRGEGGLLKTQDGMTFMERYHELANLAPRDVVARAIDAELKKRGEEFALLDVTHLDPDRLRTRFPNIHGQCRKFGIDITRQPIPVVPAAHYVCGGVETTLDGQTSVPGLFAAGECACSSLHGANRLASNSLLEALVLADRAAQKAALRMQSAECRVQDAEWRGRNHRPAQTDADRGMQSAECRAQSAERAGGERTAEGGTRDTGDARPTRLSALRQELREMMSHYAGIVRSDQGLAAASRRLDELEAEFARIGGRDTTDAAGPELGNMLVIARLIVSSARLRRESRGLHYNRDYPGRDDVHFRQNTVVTADEVGRTRG